MEKQYILPSHNIPLTLAAEVLSYLQSKPTASNSDLVRYTEKSISYISSCRMILELLDLPMEKNNKDTQKFELELISDNKQKRIFMRKAVQEFEPFITFISYCKNGNTIEDAARKVFVFFNFKNKSARFLESMFIKWGKDLDIFVIKHHNIDINSNIEIQIDAINNINGDDLNNEISIRIYISNMISPDTYGFLSKIEVKELVDSFLKEKTDPRNAVECAGRAFEDFLRRISNLSKVDVSKKNGISQVSNALYNNKDSSGKINSIIHTKQEKISLSIGAIRNMAGHSLEAKTMERWELSTISAHSFINLVLISIKSIYNYVIKNTFSL